MASHVPRLRYRKTQRDDLAECMSLLPDWLQLDDATRAALPRLHERIANDAAVYSMVMEDVALPPGRRVQAWGLALALGPDWVARLGLNGTPQPGLARQAYGALLDGSLVPMDDAALGRVNASGELAFLAMHYLMRASDPSDPYFQALISVGNESMRFGMSGHNLNAIHFENSAGADEVMRAAGFLPRDGAGVRDGLRLWGMTREEARRTMPGSTARHLFESHPPRFRLSVSQRRLLSHALYYEDDEQLADALAVSAHGLKKSWRGIYERIIDSVPDFFGDATLSDDGKRGPEKRRQVLAYVRQRPEELRPWVMP
jgi:hypothetical protein